MTECASSLINELLDYVVKGNFSIVKKILSISGIPANNGKVTDICLLKAALKSKNKDIAKLLIKAGCSVNDDRYLSYTSPLFLAVVHGDMELVQILLKKGADINVKCSTGGTCMHLAAIIGQFQILKVLLEHKCNVHLSDEHGNSVLQTFVECCLKNADSVDSEEVLKKEIVFKLLLKGASIYSVNRQNQTPIHLAAKMKKKGILFVILKYCRNVNLPDDYENTPLNYLLNSSRDDSTDTDKEQTLRLVQKMLERKAKLTAVNKNGETPVHIAAANKFLDILDLFFKFPVDINKCDKEGRNILHRIMENNPNESETEDFKNAIDTMIAKGIFIHKRDINGQTPLHVAVKFSNKIGIEVLLRHNFNTTVVDNKGNTVLHELVENDTDKDNTEIMQSLIKICSVDKRNQSGEMPIHIAAKKKKIHQLEILLKYHNDMTACDNGSNNTLFNLLQYMPSGKESIKYLKFINLLLSKNAALKPCLNLIATSVPREIFCFFINKEKFLTIRDDSLNTFLHILIKKNVEPDILQPLDIVLNCGADVNSQNSNGKTALHLAVKKQQINVVKLLLQYGADVTICTKNGNSALHLLSLANDHTTEIASKLVELLVRHGCIIDLKNKNQETPLYLALYQGSLIMSEILLNHNANINPDRSDLSTYLHLAVDRDNKQMLEILLKISSNFNVNINAKRKDGKSPLQTAVSFSRLSMVQMLLDHNADIELQDNSGKTALHWACWHDNLKIIEILLKYGANINAVDKIGINPIHLTAKINKNIIMVLMMHIEVLMEAGKFVTAANKNFYKSCICNNRLSRKYVRSTHCI